MFSSNFKCILLSGTHIKHLLCLRAIILWYNLYTWKCVKLHVRWMAHFGYLLIPSKRWRWKKNCLLAIHTLELAHIDYVVLHDDKFLAVKKFIEITVLIPCEFYFPVPWGTHVLIDNKEQISSRSLYIIWVLKPLR